MTKSKTNKDKKNSIISNSELINLIKIVGIVSLVLVIFYFITLLVDKKITKNSYKTDDQAAVIQYDEIMVGEILNRPEESYYVLVKKDADSYVTLYEQYLSMAKEKGQNIKYYAVDLSDTFNKNSVYNETIIEGNDPGQYRFSSTTLLKIDTKRLIGVYSDHESITKYLDTLIK